MKVGDYVRTKKDGIGKIIKIEPFMNDTHIFLDSEKGDITFQTKNRVCKVCNEESIIKSSPNIIDLIEVGDYVDGLKVIDIVEHLHGHKDIVMTNGKFQWSTSNDDYDIKSMVTKEQFSSMEYRINE